MLRTVVRLSPNLVIPLFTQRNENDKDLLSEPRTGPPTTGWERVKAMYMGNDYEEVSLELNNTLQSAMTGFFIGAGMGGFVDSRRAYLYFIENNQATIFKSTGEAKKRLQDYVTVAFAKGAFKWGWRLAFFTGVFSLTANTVSVYRGNTSLVEYITAGALAGALYKMELGLAATLVGASLGATLATVGGLVILGILKVSGVSMEDIKETLYKMKKAREDQYNQALEKSAEIKNDNLTDHHKVIIAEQGEKRLEDIE